MQAVKQYTASHKNAIFKKIELSFLCALFLSCLFTTVSFASSCDQIRNKVLRLHILANSDSKIDQGVKLQVRDAVLKEGQDILKGQMTCDEAEKILKSETKRLEETANRVLTENGFAYTARVEVGKSFFLTRSYQNAVTLPAGEYTAVRVLLGEAKGHNWWCVMFPPMCLPPAEKDVKMEDVLTPREEKLVESQPKIEMRFKIVEIFEKLFEKTK